MNRDVNAYPGQVEPRPNGEEERNLLHWAAALNVTREELRSALEDLGPILAERERRSSS